MICKVKRECSIPASVTMTAVSEMYYRGGLPLTWSSLLPRTPASHPLRSSVRTACRDPQMVL